MPAKRQCYLKGALPPPQPFASLSDTPVLSSPTQRCDILSNRESTGEAGRLDTKQIDQAGDAVCFGALDHEVRV